MSEEAGRPTQESRPSQTSDTWTEVGDQFQKLGESLSAAFHAAWDDERVRRHAQGARDGLEALAQEVGKVVSEMSQSPGLRQAAGSAAKTVRTAGEEAFQEIRPHLVDALRQLNQELQKFIDSMEAGEESSEGPGAPLV